MISSIIRAYNIEDIIKKLGNVKQVSSGTGHTVFLLNDGTCKAVGVNNYGQLGDGTTIDRTSVVDIPDILQCVMASPGDFSTTFVLSDGSCMAVGFNGSGQLGDGTTINRITLDYVMVQN